jgi:ABC-type transport system substrate-binding protein
MNRNELPRQTLASTRRNLLKYAALTGAGLVALPGPVARIAAAQDEPKPGGTLNVGVAAELKVLDPHITTLAAYATTLRFTIFETLVEADEEGNYIPSLAESWELADDGMSLTLNLVQNAKFHNGKDFTAEDVVFTVNRIKDPALSSQFAPQVQNVSEVEAADEYTAILKFTAPTPAILDYLLNVQIVTEQDIDGIGELPIGTGPFQFGEWVLNDHITVRKFPDYRVEGLPYLDEIVFRPVLDADTRLTNLQAGSLDLVEQPAAKDAARIEDDPNLQLIVTPPTSKYDNIQINTQNPLMAEARVRQAMSFAFDRESYVRDILYGFGTPAVCPFPQSNWAYDASICDPYLAFDLEKAGQLLEEAGHAGGQGRPHRHRARLRDDHRHLRLRRRRSLDLLHPGQPPPGHQHPPVPGRGVRSARPGRGLNGRRSETEGDLRPDPADPDGPDAGLPDRPQAGPVRSEGDGAGLQPRPLDPPPLRADVDRVGQRGGRGWAPI